MDSSVFLIHYTKYELSWEFAPVNPCWYLVFVSNNKIVYSKLILLTASLSFLFPKE